MCFNLKLIIYVYAATIVIGSLFCSPSLADDSNESRGCDQILNIKNGYTRVSSTSEEETPSLLVSHPLINGNETWKAFESDRSPWISFSFKTVARISQIALKGDGTVAPSVLMKIAYRTDPVLERDWHEFQTEFSNSFDDTMELRHDLPGLPVSIIRLHFQYSDRAPIGLQLDLYGCQETSYECSQPYGMRDDSEGGTVPNHMLSPNTGHGRLGASPWCPSGDTPRVISVTLDRHRQIDGLIVAGLTDTGNYVTKFSIRARVNMEMYWLRNDAGDLMVHTNVNAEATRHDLMYSIYTKAIELNIIAFHEQPCLAIELLTSSRPCSGCPLSIGISNSTLFPDNSFSSIASDFTNTPFYGRLDMTGPGFIVRQSNPEAIEIRLGKSYLIVEVVTQGNGDEENPKWVSQFEMESRHKSEWTQYKEFNTQRRFIGKADASAYVRHRLLNPIIAGTVRLNIMRNNNHEQSIRIELYTCRGSFIDEYEYAMSSFGQSEYMPVIKQSPNLETRVLSKSSDLDVEGVLSLRAKNYVTDYEGDRNCLFHPLNCPKGVTITFWYQGVTATPLGISNGRVPDHRISVSSTKGIICMPFYARDLLLEPFDTNYGWCPVGSDRDPFYQVDFGKETRVTHVIIRSTDVFNFGVQYFKSGQWFDYDNGEQCKCFHYTKSTPFSVFELREIIETHKIRVLPFKSSLRMYVEFLGEEGLHKDCTELFKRGYRLSNIYALSPNGSLTSPSYFFCNFDDLSGGWMVIQRRVDAAFDFRRSWDDYKTGFGDLNLSFYIGNDKLHMLTNELSELLVDMRTEDGKRYLCWYREFYVSSENDGFRLSVGASQSHNVHCNDLLLNDGEMFSTIDVDNDGASNVQCAASNTGGWWYHSRCSDVNLNGVYESLTEEQGIKWKTVTSMGSQIIFVEMQIRPRRDVHNSVGLALDDVIPDNSMTAVGLLTTSQPASAGRIDFSNAWCVTFIQDPTYMQIDLLAPYEIAGIVSQGHPQLEWVVDNFTLAMSHFGDEWDPYQENNKTVVFDRGGHVRDTKVYHYLINIAVYRYLRIFPDGKGKFCFRVDILRHCPGCVVALSSEEWSGASFSTSIGGPTIEPHFDGVSPWCSPATETYLQIRFTRSIRISRIDLKADAMGMRIDEMTLSYARGADFVPYLNASDPRSVLRWNEKAFPVMQFYLDEMIVCSVLRLAVKSVVGSPCLWIQIYKSSKEGRYDVGVADVSRLPANAFLKNGGQDPSTARLHGNYGWYLTNNPVNRFLQIDIVKPRIIVAIATQGHASRPLFFTPSYQLSIKPSAKAPTFLFYKENGQNKNFPANFDSSSVITNEIDRFLVASVLRFSFTTSDVALRIELFYSSSGYPSSCSSATGIHHSGQTVIDPDGLGPVTVMCDNSPDQGGYSVIQRRIDGSVNFNRDSGSYERGFGNFNHEFWLGNDLISRLVSIPSELLIELWTGNLDSPYSYARYSQFTIEKYQSYGATFKYDDTRSTVANQLFVGSRVKFSTSDTPQNDGYHTNCDGKTVYDGGWWRMGTDCSSDLNAPYSHSSFRWGPIGKIHRTELKVKACEISRRAARIVSAGYHRDTDDSFSRVENFAIVKYDNHLHVSMYTMGQRWKAQMMTTPKWTYYHVTWNSIDGFILQGMPTTNEVTRQTVSRSFPSETYDSKHMRIMFGDDLSYHVTNVFMIRMVPLSTTPHDRSLQCGFSPRGCVWSDNQGTDPEPVWSTALAQSVSGNSSFASHRSSDILKFNGYFGMLDGTPLPHVDRTLRTRYLLPVFGCASFWLYMIGHAEPVLTVERITVSGLSSVLYQRKGSHDDAWRMVQLPLNADLSEPFQLRFTGHVDSFFADILIDSITVMDSRCPDVSSVETFRCAMDGVYDFDLASCSCPLFTGKPWLLDKDCKRKLTAVYKDAAQYYAFNSTVVYDLLTETTMEPLDQLIADSSLVYASITSNEHARVVSAPLCFADPGKCGHAVAVTFWLKISQFPTEIANEIPLFGSSFFSKGVVVSLIPGGTVRASVVTYSKSIRYELVGIEASSWHHIAIRWDGAIQDMDAFVDGSLVPSDAKSIDTTKTLDVSKGYFSLYQYSNISTVTSLDELSLWSHNLPSNVIKDITQLSRGFGLESETYHDIVPIIYIPVSYTVTKPVTNNIAKEEAYNVASEEIASLLREANVSSFREIDRLTDLSSYYSSADAFTYRIYFNQLTLFDHISLANIDNADSRITFDFVQLYRDYFARGDLLYTATPSSYSCQFTFSLDQSSKSLVNLIKVIIMYPVWNVTEVISCPLVNGRAVCLTNDLSAFTDYFYWVFVSVAGIQVPVVASPESFKTKKSVPNPVPELNITDVSSWSMSLAWSLPHQSPSQDQLSSFFLSVVLSNSLTSHIFNVSLNPTDTFITVENLKPFTPYRVSIVAINAIGPSRPTIVTVLTDDAAPLGIPSFFRAINVTHNSVIIAWQPISRSEQRSAVVWYELKYSALVTIGNQSYSGNPVTIATPPFATSYSLTDLESLQRYDFVIEAVNSKGPGDKAYLSINTTEGELTIPPFNLKLHNLSRVSFLVSWSAIPPENHSSVLLGYQLVFFSNRYPLPIVTEMTLPDNVTSAVIGDLDQFTNYSVGVAGRASLGNGPKAWASRITDGYSDAGYDSWGAWGVCSKSCDLGLQWRHRECFPNQICLAPFSEKRNCIEFPCPIHGDWSVWNGWSSCTRSCLGGLQFRTRLCADPTPEFHGRLCEGSHNETRNCNLELCPIDGAWSEWTAYMNCNRPCNGGLRIRRRYCDNPEPQFDGASCEGENEGTIICNSRPCKDQPSLELAVKFTDEEWDPNFINEQSDRTQAFALKIDQNVRGIYQDASVVDVQTSALKPGSVFANVTIFLRQSKYLEILTLQDTIATNGMLHTMPVELFTIWSADLPAQPPKNVRVSGRTGTSIELSWDQIPSHATNGAIEGYTVFFKETIPDGSPWYSESVGQSSRSLDITHLKLFTLYSFRVAAFLSVGNGITSDELLEWTHEMPPDAAPNITVIEAINATTLYVEWDAIPVANHNGILRRYFLRYANINTPADIGNMQWQDLTYDISETRTHLYGLLPYTKYIIELAGVTGAGAGVNTREYYEMPEGAPLVAPDFVSVQSWYSTDTIIVRWTEPDLTRMQGILIGYEVHYCLIRVGSIEYPDPICRMVLADRYAVSKVISDLHMYGVFAVTVRAFTAGGTGPGGEPAFGETCRCRQRIFTLWKTHPAFVQYDGIKPYGMFPDLVKEFIIKACGVCLAHGKSEVRFLGTYSGRNPRRYSDSALQNDIGNDHSSVGFPYFGRTYMETVLGEISFIPIIVSSGAAIITLKNDFPDVTNMIVAIFRAWTLLMVMVMMTYLAGLLFWMLDQHWNPDLHPGDIWNGVGIAFWWAYTTMTTVGYGEIFPRGVLGRLFSIIWILTGLLLVAFLTGHISTVLTTQATTNKVKLYGTKVSTLNGSFEQEFALKRNAKIDRHRLYLNTKEMFQAVEKRVVEAAFVDTLDAGSEAAYLNSAPLKVESIVNTQTAFGVLLANELRYIDADVRQLISINSNRIKKLVEAKVTKIEAEQDSTPSAQDSVVVSAKAPSFKTFIIVVIVMCVAVALAGIACTHLRDGGNNKIAASSEASSRVLQDVLRQELSSFVDKFSTTLDLLDKKHISQRRKILSADGYTFYKYLIPKREKKPRKISRVPVPAEDHQSVADHVDDVDDNLAQYSPLPSMHSEVAQLQGSLLTIPAVSEDSDSDEYGHDYDQIVTN